MSQPLRWLLEGSWRTEPFVKRMRQIEANAAGEMPIVSVYSRKEATDLVARHGFRVDAVSVRKLVIEDLPGLPLIARGYRFVRRLLDAIGKLAGWYVIVRATRPPPTT